MADQDILHTAEIIKAALPYIDSHNKIMVEFIMKVIELIGYIKTLKNSLSLAACGYEAGKIDLEGMLNNIRPVCNKKERDIIDKILNIFNMKRAMEMYNNMMEVMDAMKTTEDNFNDTSTDFDKHDFDYNNPDILAEEAYDYNNPDYEESANFEEKFSNDNYNNLNNNAYDSSKPQNSSGSSGIINDKMLDMLKSLVPPEQRATFDNLSMLLTTMSYDNNSKADESKEQSNNG